MRHAVALERSKSATGVGKKRQKRGAGHSQSLPSLSGTQMKLHSSQMEAEKRAKEGELLASLCLISADFMFMLPTDAEEA